MAPDAVAIVRVEQLYPWPEDRIEQVLGRYAGATEVVWLQEEPENMGAWSFVHARLHRLLRDRYALRHVSRAESASPATGSAPSTSSSRPTCSTGRSVEPAGLARRRHRGAGRRCLTGGRDD